MSATSCGTKLIVTRRLLRRSHWPENGDIRTIVQVRSIDKEYKSWTANAWKAESVAWCWGDVFVMFNETQVLLQNTNVIHKCTWSLSMLCANADNIVYIPWVFNVTNLLRIKFEKLSDPDIAETLHHRRPRLDLPAPACAFLITREGIRKHWDQNSPDLAYVTRNYPRFFAFNAFLSRLIDIPCKNDTV